MNKSFFTLFEMASLWHGSLMIYSGYLALSIVGILIGFISWRWLKDKLYLYFSLYLSSLMAVCLFAGFLIGSSPISSEIVDSLRLSILLALVVNFSHFFFIRALIRPQERMPRLYKIQISLLALLTIADIFALYRVDEFSWNLRNQILLVMTVAHLSIQIRAALTLPFVRWYVAGAIIFLLGNVPFVLLNTGIIKSLTPFTISIPFVAALLETLFFIIGLVDRLRYEYLRNLNESRVKMMGIAAAEIFHEIATPLTIISLSADKLKKQYSQIQSDKVEIDRLMELANSIEKSAKRISSNVEKFRTFSGIQDRTIKNDKVLAKEVIEGAIELFKRKVEMRGCTFTLIDEISCSVYLEGNKFDLEQIISNLVINAADAIQNQEEKWIKLQTTQSGNFIKLQVIDSGKGISKEIQDKIFNEFFTTKGRGEGTGLGLSICKRFAEAHGGYLKLDTKSENTCFVVELPITKVS